VREQAIDAPAKNRFLTGAALIISKNLLFLSLAGLAAWRLMRGRRATCGNKP
jgi:hypothetical protein